MEMVGKYGGFHQKIGVNPRKLVYDTQITIWLVVQLNSEK
jgi:hypothetical protein